MEQQKGADENAAKSPSTEEPKNEIKTENEITAAAVPSGDTVEAPKAEEAKPESAAPVIPVEEKKTEAPTVEEKPKETPPPAEEKAEQKEVKPAEVKKEEPQVTPAAPVVDEKPKKEVKEVVAEKEVCSEETPPPLPMSPPPTPVSVLAQSTMAETVPADILVKALNVDNNIVESTDIENKPFSVIQVAASDSAKESPVENAPTTESSPACKIDPSSQTENITTTVANSSNAINANQTNELKEKTASESDNKNLPVSETVAPQTQEQPKSPETEEKQPVPPLPVTENIPSPTSAPPPSESTPECVSDKTEAKAPVPLHEVVSDSTTPSTNPVPESNTPETKSPTTETPLPEPPAVESLLPAPPVESLPEPPVESPLPAPPSELLPEPPKETVPDQATDSPTKDSPPPADAPVFKTEYVAPVSEPAPTELPPPPPAEPTPNPDVIPSTDSAIPSPDTKSSTGTESIPELSAEPLPAPPADLISDLSASAASPPSTAQIISETDKNAGSTVESVSPAEPASLSPILPPAPSEVTNSAPETQAEKVVTPQEVPQVESVPVTSAPLLDDSLLSKNVAPEIKQETAPVENGIATETKLDESRGDVPNPTTEKIEQSEVVEPTAAAAEE